MNIGGDSSKALLILFSSSKDTFNKILKGFFNASLLKNQNNKKFPKPVKKVILKMASLPMKLYSKIQTISSKETLAKKAEKRKIEKCTN